MKKTSVPVGIPVRRRLPDTRTAINQKLVIHSQGGPVKAYVTVGLFENGDPAELFVHIDKEGSTLSGLLDDLGITVSMLLQYGVPLEVIVTKLAHQRFEPSGPTNIEQVRFATSITDLVFRWMGHTFLKDFDKPQNPAPQQ